MANRTWALAMGAERVSLLTLASGAADIPAEISAVAGAALARPGASLGVPVGRRPGEDAVP